MHTLLRDLTLLAAVTAAGGWALVRALAPRSSTAVASTAPIVNSGDDCTSRVALSPPTPARFEFQVDHPARFLGFRGRPRPPAIAAQGSRPLVQFVVDASGKVVTSSVRVLHVFGDTAAVAPAIRSAAHHWRYSPAMVGGCPTSQIVQTVIEP